MFVDNEKKYEPDKTELFLWIKILPGVHWGNVPLPQIEIIYFVCYPYTRNNYAQFEFFNQKSRFIFNGSWPNHHVDGVYNYFFMRLLLVINVYLKSSIL